MNTASANAIWALRIVRACVQAGVAHAFISPGSRNTPLLLALEKAGVKCTVVVDERSAGFVALGYIRASEAPAAVVCTSGSAPFHYGPAVAEADASSLPLVVLSADRPARLRGCGSMQTSLQANLFADVLRATVDLPAPRHGEESLAAVEAGLAALKGNHPGPVALNLQFEEPLWNQECEALPRGHQVVVPALSRDFGFVDQDTVPPGFFESGRRGLITVGPPAFAGLGYPADFERAVYALSSKTGWPILAELHSGLRKEHPNVLKYPDLCARILSHRAPDEAESVLHFGLLPTSKNVQGLLNAANQVVHVDTRPDKRLPLSANLKTYRASPMSLTALVPDSEDSPSSTWNEAWVETDRHVGSGLDALVSESLFEPNLAKALMSSIEPSGVLVVANSMPIRQTDVWVGQLSGGRQTMVARGVSGIDGTISAAVGAAIALEKPVWVFLGDLAFLHDVSSLALVRQLGLPIRVVVSDNRGGGIFRRLPISGHPSAFESHFITPQDQLNLRDIAGGFGVEAQEVSTHSHLISALQSMRNAQAATVLIVKTDSEFDVAEEKRIFSSLLGGTL